MSRILTSNMNPFPPPLCFSLIMTAQYQRLRLLGPQGPCRALRQPNHKKRKGVRIEIKGLNARELLDQVTLPALLHVDIVHIESAIARHHHDLRTATAHRDDAA